MQLSSITARHCAVNFIWQYQFRSEDSCGRFDDIRQVNYSQLGFKLLCKSGQTFLILFIASQQLDKLGSYKSEAFPLLQQTVLYLIIIWFKQHFRIHLQELDTKKNDDMHRLCFDDVLCFSFGQPGQSERRCQLSTQPPQKVTQGLFSSAKLPQY